MSSVRILATSITVVLLVVLPSSLSGATLYNFESYSDGALLGDGAVLDPGEVLTTFGLPIGNQAPPLVTAVNATTVTPITLGGGSVSARFTADWSLDAASPFFAGIRLVNPQTDLTTATQAMIDIQSDGAGTTTVGLLINDGTTSYEHTTTAILAGENTYTFDFTDTPQWVRTDGNPATTYAQVLANAQFIGFTMLRGSATVSVETFTFDNLSVIPEPASVSLLAFGVLLLRKRALRS